MDYSENDKRAHQRRLLQVPVICYPTGSRCEPHDWIFGETVDVGTDGLRIRARGQLRLQPGAELDLLILDPGGQDVTHREDVPACIRARVSWVEKGQHVFGVEYIKNCC